MSNTKRDATQIYASVAKGLRDVRPEQPATTTDTKVNAWRQWHADCRSIADELRGSSGFDAPSFMKLCGAVPSETPYYIQPRGDGKFDLRQTRHRDAFLAGKEHPNDSVAVSFSGPEMRDLLAAHFPHAHVDLSPLETPCQLPHSQLAVGATCACGFTAEPMDEEDVRAAHEVSNGKDNV